MIAGWVMLLGPPETEDSRVIVPKPCVHPVRLSSGSAGCCTKCFCILFHVNISNIAYTYTFYNLVNRLPLMLVGVFPTVLSGTCIHHSHAKILNYY